MTSTTSYRSWRSLDKLPKILVLCEDSKKQGEISAALKSVLANEMCAIGGIAWDELGVGGWADQAVLLVFVSGKIPDPNTYIPNLLQFVGDGGRLLAWSCQSTSFGPNSDSDSTTTASPGAEAGNRKNEILIYGSSETKPMYLSSTLWGVSNEAGDLPPGFKPLLGTTNSDEYPRPLAASVFAKT